MEALPVDHDPFSSGEISTLAPTTEPQFEVIAAAAMSHEANTAYNEAVSLRIRGRLDAGVVERALATIVYRHDALRSTFTPQLDELVVTSQNRFVLERRSGLGEPAERQAALLQQTWLEMSSTPMALNDGPLFRAVWLQYGEDDAELVLLAHHAICDGWSIQVILRELSILCAEGSVALPPAPSFAAFAEARQVRAAKNPDAGHWMHRFADKPAALDLPTDRPRPARRTFTAHRVDHAFTAEATREIAAAAGRMRASSVGVLLAGVATLLNRLVDVNDITVGMPVARQALEDLGDLVGHCVQLLPIRLAVDDGMRFEDLVAQARSTLLDASEHYDFTFGGLVRALGMSGDASRVPLLPVIVNVDKPLTDMRLGDAVATVRTVPRTAEAFEVFLNVMPNAVSWVVEATFNSDLFNDDTIRIWLATLENLLVAAAADPAQPLHALSLLATSSATYSAFNATARLLQERSWIESMVAQAVRDPTATAVIDGRGELPYGELLRRARALAHELLRRGVRPGDVVGLCTSRSVDLPVALAGIHLAGAAHLPIDPDFPTGRQQFQIGDSGTRIVVVDGANAETHVPPGVALLDIGTVSECHGTADPALPSLDGKGLAYVIYTSGSTGKPKGVRLQHEALANLLASVRRRPGLTSEDTVVAITTIAFDISLLELLAPLTAGGRVVIASREEAEDPQVLAALLRRHGATVMQATPATWRMLVDDGWAGRTSMRAFCGGERLPRDLAAELLPRVHSLWNLYGPTETCVWSSAAVVRDGATAALVGTPFDNTVILILGRGSVLLPPGFPGEICIGGLGLAEGYQNQPRLTADRFLVHPEYGRLYRTGDRGRLLPSGTLECLGRMDDQVKVRGFRIELGEIETVLAEHPLVDEAAVALVTEDPRGPRITAYAVCRGAELSFAAMRDHLGKSLPAYMVPQQLVVLRALPRLPNGKLDRRLLPKVTSTAAPAIAATALPETPTERIVVDEMRKVLRIERLGVDQDFFDVGGHSLLAAHLVARLNREFDAALTMRAVFELPTPRKLAHAICTGNSRSRASARPVVHRVDQRISPVTHVQDRIWFMERMLAGRPTYNLPSAHRLVGTFDEAVFARAFQAIVDRQSALRTTFERRDGQLLQVVHDHLVVDMLPIEDLTGHPASAREARLMERLEQLTATTFDLRELPLFRVRLFRLSDKEHVFFFMPHHIVWDGWSFDILYEELSANYEAFLAGRPNPHMALAVTFGDFAAWHRELLGSTDAHQQTRQWRDRLARFGPVKRLPVDRDSGVSMSGDGATEWVTIDGTRTQALHELARANGATLFVTTLALYTVLLHGYARQSKLLLATPVRGRESLDLEPVMGCCNSLLPLPIEIRPDDTFEQLLACVKAVVLDSFAKPDVLLEQITATQPAGSGPSSPQPISSTVLYQALFSFQDVRRRTLKWGGLEHSMIQLFQKGATEDLGLWFVERENGLVGGLTHNVEVLTRETVLALRDAFTRIVDAVLAEPSTPVASLAAGLGKAVGNEEGPTQRKATPRIVGEGDNHRKNAGRMMVSEGELRDYEFILLQIWQRAIGNDRLTVNDDFFDSGGNSLAAIQSVVEFETATGITIDLGELFRSPTVAAVVKKIGTGGPSAPAILIPLQPHGDGIPLFCLLGIQVYRHLASRLGAQSPIFGVYVREEQAFVSGATSRKPAPVSIGRLASAYFEIIRKACPSGPLRLAGLSYGGVVAMEVARRLSAAGVQVETVLLLDTILPSGYRRSRLAILRALLVRAWNLGIKGIARSLVDRFRTVQGQLDPAPETSFESHRRDAFALEHEISRWVADLAPPPWRVILVRANDNSAWGRGFRFTASYGWEAWLGDRLTTVRVDGDHLGILAPPYVEKTVEELHRLLGGR